jgi:predicted transcriptional regulator
MDQLAEAQKRSEERIDQLTIRMDQLAVRMDQLAEAQKRTEERVDQLTIRMDQLAVRMDQLAEAQKRTEEQLHLLTLRVDQLAEAQKVTEQKLAELAEAQKRTEIRLDKTNEQLGGLSMSFGYFLENESYKYLPALLLKDYGLKVEGELTRSYLKDKQDGYLEVNILGQGIKDGKQYLIVGESKSQLSVNSIDKFIYKKLERIVTPEGKKVFPILVCHMVSGPEVADYAKRREIALYYSYQFK